MNNDTAQRQRRRLLLFSVPVLLVALLLACKLLSLPVFAGQAAHSFATADGSGTVKAARGLGAVNLVERWKAPFALGDGYALRGDFAGAREQFSRALTLAPESAVCKVRVNLVLTLEQLGDAAQKAGDPASSIEYYGEGAATAAQSPRGCFMANSSSNQDGEGDRLKQAAVRLAGKLKSATQAKDPAQGGASDQPAEGQAPQGKLDQLEQRSQGAQRDGQRARPSGTTRPRSRQKNTVSPGNVA